MSGIIRRGLRFARSITTPCNPFFRTHLREKNKSHKVVSKVGHPRGQIVLLRPGFLIIALAKGTESNVGLPATQIKMVPAASLLALLLPEFRDKEENIMTLALFHVLQQHRALKDSFIAWIFEKVSQTPPQRLRISPQVQTECAREAADNGRRRWIRPDICFLGDQKDGRAQSSCSRTSSSQV